jgi:hypothetical protein
MSDAGSFRSSERPASDYPVETTAELKADIDAGRTGDKVDATDLAAVPLGTDDEAAGTPASQERIALARETERGPERMYRTETPARTGTWIWAVGAAVVVMLGLLLLR